MREIKFRIFDEHDGKMYIPERLLCSHDGSVVHGGGMKLMQYTGLKDKNGVEIYEGDVVKNKDGDIYDIKFEFNNFNGRYMVDEWQLEIIGNIYESPELLSTNKDEKQRLKLLRPIRW